MKACKLEGLDESPVYVLNNFMRAWGHQFIYDKQTLMSALRNAGFARIEECELQVSSTKYLCNLAQEHRLPPGFLDLETMTFEALKEA